MKRSCGVFLLALLSLGATLQATTLVRMNLDELAMAASLVARVRCLENESRWEGGEIWTFTRFEVLETLKGTAPREISVRLLGGRVGRLIASVEGVPRFQPGEEAFLFLEPTRAGELSVTSWVQGTFRIRRETVTQDTGGLVVFDAATRQFRPGGIRHMPIEQFRERVRVAIESPGKARPQ